ncbi:MAG: hypothetical protein ACXU82_10405 [Caulobacteraceae bacterium]
MQSSVAAANAAWNPRTDRKAYIVWMTLIWAGTLIGFGLDFARYFGEAPPPPAILHFHGAVYVLWLGLVSTQILLVEKGDIRLHKNLGWATAVVSAAMVPLGVVAALVDQARQVGHPDYAPQFLGLEFVDMVAFAVFIGAGLLWRKDVAAHKRLMILSAMAIVDASFSRAWQIGVKVTAPGPLGWWWQYFWGTTLMLIAMVGWDLWRRKRIHPAVLFGMAVLWGGEIVSILLQFSPAWKTAMVALVRAWAWTG